MVEYVVGVVPKDVKVLEATAGTADISVAVADKAERVLCTDLSEKMLKITEHKAKYKTNIGFAIRGIYDLKEPDNSYDVVTASQVLHLLDKPELAATELKRITKDIIIAPIVNLDFEGYKDFLNKIGLQDC